MIAVGDHVFGKTPDVLIRASTALGGGIGCSHQEVCGIVSGGCMILGAMFGRTRSEDTDEKVCALSTSFLERFAAKAGSSNCDVIRESLPDVENRCTPVLKEGVRILLELIEANRQGLKLYRV